MTEDERFLVTGSMGCIGAWVLRTLVREGTTVVAADLATEPVRPALIMSDDELASVTFTGLDVTDAGAVREAIAANAITHVVHLAGLQIPFCQADPVAGARVNVVGTVNVFEAARTAPHVRGVSYASSLAVMGPSELYRERPVPDDAPLAPTTLYGAYKQADEACARVFAADWGLASVGLRPYVVYGVGRDQGMTADIAKAILAAAIDRPYRIRFGGDVALQYAPDVAAMFVGAARAATPSAPVCNLRNDVVSVPAFLSVLDEVVPGHRVEHDATSSLPYPADLDDSGLRSLLGEIPHTPLRDAIADSVDRCRELVAADRIDLGQLDR